MRDCPNARMRDLLPELLHGGLSESVRAEVQAHVDRCADCRAELALLRRVRDAIAAPLMDTSHIVASVPPYRAPSAFRRATRSWPLRAAAAVVLLAGGALVARDRATHIGGADTLLAASRSPELAVGALADISESDLRSLLNELEKFEAMTPAEPAVIVVPSVDRGGE